LEAFIGWLRGFHLDREKSKAADWALVVFTALGLFAAAYSALLVYRQLKDGQANFMLDERAWIELEPMKPPKVVKDKDGTISLFYKLNLKNVGKTVASATRLHAGFLGRDAAFIGDERRIKAEQDKLANEDRETQAEVERKMDQFEGKVNKQRKLNIEHWFQTVIAPGAESTVPEEMWTEYPTVGPNETYFVGHLSYDDLFRVHHWLRFCYLVARKEGDEFTLFLCQYGNNVDANLEIAPEENQDSSETSDEATKPRPRRQGHFGTASTN